MFVTSRAVRTENNAPVFSGAATDALTYGRAVVGVEGSAYAEDPNMDVIYHWARDVRSTPISHFKTKRTVTLDRSEALTLAGQIATRSTEYQRQTFVFIHGYGTPFDTALRRAAQIAHDLLYDAPVFVFSWPSAAGVLDYGLDQAVARKSSAQLASFLSRDLGSASFGTIHLIAHSMGNLVLLGALAQVQADHSVDELKLGEVIMVAPDVDRELFLNTISGINVPLNYTIYTSRHDQALKVSECVNQAERLGRLAPELNVLETSTGSYVVDLIDVSDGSSNSDQWNHSRVFENPYLVQDMAALLYRRTRPPNARTPEFGMVVLDPNPASFKVYFQFQQPRGTWDIEGSFNSEPTWIDWLRSLSGCAPAVPPAPQ